MGAGSVRGQRPDLIVYDEAVDLPESPYRLDDPPDNLKGEFLSGSLVNAQFSGVVYINMQHEWDEWKVRLEKIARDGGVRMGIKAWLDPRGGVSSTATRAMDWLEGRQPDAGKSARVIVQLQVDDPELPDDHRVKTYQATADWPQRALWMALHAAGLVLEPEFFARRRPVRDDPQA